MRVILYDYETEKVRGKVRKALKKIGLHAQWSVFESEENLKKLLTLLMEEKGNYRVALFRVKPNCRILRLGKTWEKFEFVL
ncbi:MAG: CRISPR-associated endonuclease Cas2 [Caldimicrobium sp.]|nr:CRISPR-associated endonuclease Cas2 [Caldimicrobium sp.]MDW8095112.1 CRISPR-associated endonuclease Cas2 [Caldimicrobium sp.]